LGFPKLEEQQAIVSFIEVASRELNAIIDMVSREIALLQEFRTRLIADAVTAIRRVRALAASLPEIAGEEPIDELPNGEDLDEAIGDTGNEEAAA
jgi:type I restriction enzyme S subunit